ncbi:hypothetical protein H5410_012255 [Solanum commersonii]|uniref:Uncharacterized protein n=1 Tax=Solanum commersonii TaxID=4109 RepID=A0A9J6AR05_SOLCO|nr:hypothetical protein H5410_012255 [Solanum commersonii]
MKEVSDTILWMTQNTGHFSVYSCCNALNSEGVQKHSLALEAIIEPHMMLVSLKQTSKGKDYIFAADVFCVTVQRKAALVFLYSALRQG